MRKGYNKRKEGGRRPRSKVIIVCEGKKTEQNYFNGLKTRNSGVEIITYHGKCTDPKSIVNFTKGHMKNKWSIDFDEGDGVWCAFDVDENTTQVLKEAYESANSKNIQIALSNPCFELWFLLHYKEIFHQMSRKDVIDALKQFIPNYEKNLKINEDLKNHVDDAIKNAKKLNKLHEGNDIELYTRESNPSTQVFSLIAFIHKLVVKNKSN